MNHFAIHAEQILMTASGDHHRKRNSGGDEFHLHREFFIGWSEFLDL